MSIIFSEKVKLIRISEGLSQKDFSELTGISINTIKGYEHREKEISSPNLHLVTSNPRLEKYTLWLMTGKVCPEAGQISPEVEEIAGDYGKTGTDTK